ncbi:MAG: site-specific integrase [Chloroflexota bacterium]
MRKSFYGKTRRAVVEQMDQFRTEIRSGLAVVGRAPLLREWLDYWLQHIVKPNREPTTYELYEVLVRLHIAPYIGDLRLGRLRTETIEAWLENLERAGVGLRTRQSALIRLRTAITLAVERSKLGSNPAVHVEPPKGNGRAKYQAPMLGDGRRLLTALEPNPRLRLFALLWLGQGLRRGETLGLRWDDIQFESGYVIGWTITYRRCWKMRWRSLQR